MLDGDGLAAGRRQLDLTLENLEEIHPAAGLLEQAIERLDGLEVLRVELEDGLIGLDGPLGIAELAVVDLAEDEVHLLLFLDGRGELRLLAVNVLEAVPTLEPDIEPLERLDGHAVILVEGEHLPEDRNGVVRALEYVLVNLRRLEQKLFLLGHALDDVGLAQDDLDQVGVG